MRNSVNWFAVLLHLVLTVFPAALLHAQDAASLTGTVTD
jgi:hypothetical protein